jgi:hypothetical protein
MNYESMKGILVLLLLGDIDGCTRVIVGSSSTMVYSASRTNPYHREHTRHLRTQEANRDRGHPRMLMRRERELTMMAMTMLTMVV